MHRTKLSLTIWFWAAHLMATHSNGMSAQQLKGQLGLSYGTAWLLAQKLRRSMVDPNRDPLEGVVEVDQSEMPLRTDDGPYSPLKTGKIIVLGAVEVIDRTAQARPYTTTERSATQDRRRHAAGRRPLRASYRPSQTWDNAISL